MLLYLRSGKITVIVQLYTNLFASSNHCSNWLFELVLLAWPSAEVLLLTWFGSGGRGEDSDHQQDEEEQAEDPHGCLSASVNEISGVVRPLGCAFSFCQSVSEPPRGGTQFTEPLLSG